MEEEKIENNAKQDNKTEKKKETKIEKINEKKEINETKEIKELKKAAKKETKKEEIKKEIKNDKESVKKKEDKNDKENKAEANGFKLVQEEINDEEKKKDRDNNKDKVKDEIKDVIKDEVKTEGNIIIEKIEKKKLNIKSILLSGLIGMIIGAAIVTIIWKTGKIDLRVIAKTKQGNYTESMFMDSIKEELAIEYVLDGLDEMLLDKNYKLSDEQEKEIDEQYEKVLNLYKSYGYTEDYFLRQNGFDSKEEFRKFLGLDFQRNLVYIDYLKTKISVDEIKQYYDENVYGEINTKHILVEVTDKVNDEEAKKLAEEIIKELDKGKDFDAVAKAYGSRVRFEELGYNGHESGLVAEYEEASKEMPVGTYSKTPVKTMFGYHIIYKIDEKEKPTLEEATNDIIETLGAVLEKADKNIRYKALIKFREDNGVEFKDEVIKKKYEEYCKTYGI